MSDAKMQGRKDERSRVQGPWSVMVTSVWVVTLTLATNTRPVWAEPPEQQPPAGIVGGSAGEAASTGEQPSDESKEPQAASAEGEQHGSQKERLRTVVDLSFTNANLKNVLNSLAKAYGLNIVAGEKVSGTVTLTLREVMLEDGLRQLLKLNGYGFTVSSQGIIEVVKLEEKRVANLLYLKYLAPDTALEFLQPFASEGATLKVDEPNSAILVNDYINKIDDMRDVLATIDQPPQQVLIESRLIDITHSDLDNLGLSFSSVGKTIPIKSGGAKSNPPLVISSGSSNLGSISTSTSAARTSHEFTFTLAQGSGSLTANIDALIQNQRVKVIANPAILTLNNVEAKITIGEKFPIREQTQTSTGTLQSTRFVDVGTTLRVTPKINRDKYIQMHIHPEVSSVSSTLDAGPRITTREADTTVLVRDGQPIVIAGLLKEDNTSIKQRVPLLGQIPIIGLAFQNRSKDHTQKELVVIITPTLINVTEELTAAAPVATTSGVQQIAARLEASELFKEGLAMEDNQTLKAQQLPEMVRSLEAMHMYQLVADRFPTNPYAIEALWRLGRLARTRVYDLALAEATFQRLLTQFPGSIYHARAMRELDAVRREQARLVRQARRRGQTAPATEPPTTAGGFR